MSLSPFLIAIIVLAVLVIVLLSMSVKTVTQGYEWTVERFGRYHKTLRPGLHIIVPVMDKIGSKVNVREQVMDVPSQEVITKDNAIVTVDGIVYFQVLSAKAATYEVSNLFTAILNLVMTNLRTVVGSMDLDETLSQREHINTKLMHVVDEATNPWGVKVTRIEIADIQPPRDIADAMGRQMKAEREKRAAILEAEGLRQSEILKAEGLKQSKILEAEGRREAAFRDAEARERAAEAEAQATRMVSEAIASGDIQAINYFVATKYVDSLRDIASAPNQKVMFLPMEATSILGSLGGIGEIANEVFKKGKG
ncbi:MAG: SPFH domain-containing protein [Alphaproteobacteria bacterium]